MSQDAQFGEILATLKAIDHRIAVLESASRDVEGRRIITSEAIGRNRGRIDILTDKLEGLCSAVSDLKARNERLEKELVREEGRRAVAAKLGVGGLVTGVGGVLIGVLGRFGDFATLLGEALRHP